MWFMWSTWSIVCIIQVNRPTGFREDIKPVALSTPMNPVPAMHFPAHHIPVHFDSKDPAFCSGALPPLPQQDFDRGLGHAVSQHRNFPSSLQDPLQASCPIRSYNSDHHRAPPPLGLPPRAHDIFMPPAPVQHWPSDVCDFECCKWRTHFMDKFSSSSARSHTSS